MRFSLCAEEGGRGLLCVEVFRPDGIAKFCLWFYKWQETRLDRPYVGFEII